MFKTEDRDGCSTLTIAKGNELNKWMKSVVCGLSLNKTVKKMQLKYTYTHVYVSIHICNMYPKRLELTQTHPQ